MPEPRDLGTVLIRPRETMRRVLDGANRWWWQLAIATALATSIVDPDFKGLRAARPALRSEWLIPIAIGALIVVAGARVLFVWIFAWITYAVGRLLGGTATVRDLCAALAWGLVPILWASVYFVIEAILGRRMIPQTGVNEREVIMNALAQGGCSLVVVALAMRLLIGLACVWVASATVAEAQRFPLSKGFANIALAVVAPLAVVAAAVIASHV